MNIAGNRKLLPQVEVWQKARQRMFKSVPVAGKVVRYLGKEFLVYRNTFWPFEDSKPLIKNFRVRKGESVLDVGTGSGVIAVFAGYKGAGRILAIDINPAAVRSARYNLATHGFATISEVKMSDLFAEIGKEKFDVIVANLPFRDKLAHDLVSQSQWDSEFKVNVRFFKEAHKFLKPNGRIYFSQSNFGALGKVRKLARSAGYSMRKIGNSTPNPKGTFYAFVLKRSKRD